LPFCHQSGHSLELGIEKFCPSCGYNLQNGQAGQNVNSANVTDTQGDVFGVGFTGSGNIIEDIHGNIFLNGGNLSEQFKNIMEFSTTLDTSTSNRDTDNANINKLNQVTKTKQQTRQVLDDI
jgi:hypothetical protein